MCVCVCVRTRRQLGALYVAVKGSVYTLFHLFRPPPSHVSPSSSIVSRNDVKKLDFNYRNRVLSRGRASETKKMILCAMKFEFTRAQLMPAKFIGRCDGKCAFHDYRQVTRPTTLFTPRLRLVKDSRASLA